MEQKNKIKIIIPFFNPGDFLDMCISSVLTQDYDNYEVLFIDDCSTDNSFSKIPGCTYKIDENNNPVRGENGELIILEKHPLLERTKCSNVVAWKASSRATALPNLHNGIMNFATNADDIVVILDGDDWLLGKGALSYINEFYNQNPECWMMYGSSKWTDGRKCCSSPYPEYEFKNLRAAPFRISHIRTFRAGLYHKIQDQDKTFSCMKDKEGNWFTMTYDVAMFFPMLEMAGFEHVKHNPKPLYIYNRDNPISDDKVNQQKQWDIHEEIANKNNFDKIKTYKKEEEEKVLVYCGVNNGDGLQVLNPYYDKIFAFDANPEKIEICKRRFGHENKITFINAALHEKDGEEITFNITEKWDAASSIGKLNPEYTHLLSEESPLHTADVDFKEIKVKTINLQNFLKEQNIEHIDYLLTDLQGYDFAILNTIKDYIDNGKIDYITCEVEENNSRAPVYLDIPSNKKENFDNLLSQNYEELSDKNNHSDGWNFDCNWKLKTKK